MSITIYNYTPPLSTSEQVVADANANNYTLSKYIGIDSNGKITKEIKTISDPVAGSVRNIGDPSTTKKK